MNLEEAKKTKEAVVIDLAAQIWNETLKIEGLPDYDQRVINEYIHRIQDMMYTRLFIEIYGNI